MVVQSQGGPDRDQHCLGTLPFGFRISAFRGAYILALTLLFACGGEEHPEDADESTSCLPPEDCRGSGTLCYCGSVYRCVDGKPSLAKECGGGLTCRTACEGHSDRLVTCFPDGQPMLRLRYWRISGGGIESDNYRIYVDDGDGVCDRKKTGYFRLTSEGSQLGLSFFVCASGGCDGISIMVPEDYVFGTKADIGRSDQGQLMVLDETVSPSRLSSYVPFGGDIRLRQLNRSLEFDIEAFFEAAEEGNRNQILVNLKGTAVRPEFMGEPGGGGVANGGQCLSDSDCGGCEAWGACSFVNQCVQSGTRRRACGRCEDGACVSKLSPPESCSRESRNGECCGRRSSCLYNSCTSVRYRDCSKDCLNSWIRCVNSCSYSGCSGVCDTRKASCERDCPDANC